MKYRRTICGLKIVVWCDELGEAPLDHDFLVLIRTCTPHFVSSNVPPQDFRTTEDVDILSFDTDSTFRVGWITPGEYLRYTVDVTEDGTEQNGGLQFRAPIALANQDGITGARLRLSHESNATERKNCSYCRGLPFYQQAPWHTPVTIPAKGTVRADHSLDGLAFGKKCPKKSLYHGWVRFRYDCALSGRVRLRFFIVIFLDWPGSLAQHPWNTSPVVVLAVLVEV